MSVINTQSLHYLQQELLKKLASKKGLHFNELIIEGLESEHVNYHIKKLIEYKLALKAGDLYDLTDDGKDFVNSLDDISMEVEKQPKTSVIINGRRINERGEVEHLLSRRLKQPYFGKIGKIGGKVRFGETLEAAARRELFEETGLTAKNFTLETVYHKLRHREDGEYVQDVIFYIFFVTEFQGEFIERIPYQENLWLSEETSEEYKKDFYDDLKLNDRMEPHILKFTEDDNVAQGF